MQVENGSQKAGCPCAKVQGRIRFASPGPFAIGLEFSNISEPTQSALNLCTLHGVTAGELFQSNLLKPGAL